MFGANTTHHLVPVFIFSNMVVAASCYGYACHRQTLGVFKDKNKWNTAISTGKNLEENLVVCFLYQTLSDEFTFQQDNNLKHKAKYTLELLTKVTLNALEWLSYSFDLNLLEDLWLENSCLAMIENQLDRA